MDAYGIISDERWKVTIRNHVDRSGSNFRVGLRVIRPLDIVAVGIALAVFGASIGFTLDRSSGPPVVEIQGAHERWVYPLDTKKTVSVPGPLGVTHVVLDGGGAYIHDSPCKGKIGINMGRITTAGSWVACLPNRVFVRIEGAANKGVDIVAY